jgi:hypothetical protein
VVVVISVFISFGSLECKGENKEGGSESGSDSEGEDRRDS